MKKKIYQVPLAESLEIILEDHFLIYPNPDNQLPGGEMGEGGDY